MINIPPVFKPFKAITILFTGPQQQKLDRELAAPPIDKERQRLRQEMLDAAKKRGVIAHELQVRRFRKLMNH